MLPARDDRNLLVLACQVKAVSLVPVVIGHIKPHTDALSTSQLLHLLDLLVLVPKAQTVDGDGLSKSETAVTTSKETPELCELASEAIEIRLFCEHLTDKLIRRKCVSEVRGAQISCDTLLLLINATPLDQPEALSMISATEKV